MCQDLLSKKNTKKGFSIIEIAISMVMISILAVALSLNMYNSLFISVKNNDIVKANNLTKAYIKEQELNWLMQFNYDKGDLVAVDSTYTDNGRFDVTVSSTNLQRNSSNIVILRRVVISYRNQKNELLSNVFYDFSRPAALAN